MILNFDMQDIIKSAIDLSTFRSGLDLFKNNKVKHFNYHEGLQRAFSKVEDEEWYTVDIAFTERGFETAYCECRDYFEHEGNCKHIVSTLIYAKLSGGSAFEKNKLSEIMDYYLNQEFEESHGLEVVNIGFEMMFHKEEAEVGIALKIGKDKTYVVKDLVEFFKTIEKKEEVVFGKKFSFDPYFHGYSTEDQEIMTYLGNLSEAYDYHHWGTFNEASAKYLLLSPKETLKVLSLLKGRHIDVVYKDKPTIFLDTLVCEGFVEVGLDLKQNNDQFHLNLQGLKDFVSLEKTYGIFYHDFKLYTLNSNMTKELKPLLEMVALGYDHLVVPEKELNDFIAYMYPIINKHFPIKMTESIENNVEWKTCEAMLYLDLEDTRVIASLKYKYGDHIFDAFEGLESEAYDHVVIRDLIKENHIMHLIEAAAFKVSKTGYYLEEPQGIYQFLREGLKALSKKVTIYYAEDFKALKMIKGDQLSFTTSFDGEASFFDFSFTLEGIHKEDMEAFIKSLKEKKKYYRLKDGTFIDLDHAHFHKMGEIFTDLNLSGEDVQRDKVILPVYFSSYLNNQLKDFKETYHKDHAFEHLIEAVNHPEIKKYKVPKIPNIKIRGYQKKGFNWLKTLSDFHFGGILADDMGLGKTLQTLMYITSEKEEKQNLKVLIVAPTSLTYNWLNEVYKFFPDLKAKVIEGTKKQRADMISKVDDFDLMITSYALVRNDLEIYQKLKLDICIIDEAQHIKNPDSKTAKAIKQLKVTHRFALTGTPIENGLSELWSIFDFIMPQYLGDIGSFKKKYDQEVHSESDHEALRKIIKPFILRRLKKDVLKELPEKIENKVVVELLEEQKKVYVSYLTKVREDLGKAYALEGFKKSQMKTLVALTRLRQIALDPSLFLENFHGKSAKFELLKELLEELLAGQHKILIFSQFTGVLSRIEKILEQISVAFYRIDGSTPSLKRHEQVQKFNEDDTPVFLISLRAGGTGLNLTGADTVIHFDPWWNPAVENQATDRAHRIGQKNTVHVIKLITQGTIEEKIFALQEKKKLLIEQVIEPGETWITKLTEKEIKDLFV